MYYHTARFYSLWQVPLYQSRRHDYLPENNAPQPPKYQDVFGKSIVELAKLNEKIVGITPAMPSGSSMNIMMKEMPDRAFDVGIAEQHAVTFAAGLATQGVKPVVAMYATFLQRAYDQVVHDVATQNLPVVFCIDRGGLVAGRLVGTDELEAARAGRALLLRVRQLSSHAAHPRAADRRRHPAAAARARSATSRSRTATEVPCSGGSKMANLSDP